MKSKLFGFVVAALSVFSLGVLLAPVPAVSALGKTDASNTAETASRVGNAVVAVNTVENQTASTYDPVIVATNGGTSAGSTAQQFLNAAQTPGSGDINICNAANVPEEIRQASGCEGENNVEITGVVINIINGILGILGLVAVCFIIYGGIQYMTSAGDASKLKKAKDTILYAAVGLVVSALAFAITNFVIGIIYNNNSAASSAAAAETEVEEEATEAEQEQNSY